MLWSRKSKDHETLRIQCRHPISFELQHQGMRFNQTWPSSTFQRTICLYTVCTCLSRFRMPVVQQSFKTRNESDEFGRLQSDVCCTLKAWIINATSVSSVSMCKEAENGGPAEPNEKRGSAVTINCHPKITRKAWWN